MLRLGQQILSSPALVGFFDPAGIAWAGNEVPIAVDGQCLRIDRLVRLKPSGAWWVLDFKLAHNPQSEPALREQLARYRSAVAAQQPGEPVHAGFVTSDGRLVVLD